MTTGRKLHVATTRNKQRFVAAINRNWPLNKIPDIPPNSPFPSARAISTYTNPDGFPLYYPGSQFSIDDASRLQHLAISSGLGRYILDILTSTASARRHPYDIKVPCHWPLR